MKTSVCRRKACHSEAERKGRKINRDILKNVGHVLQIKDTTDLLRVEMSQSVVQRRLEEQQH